MEPFNVLTQTRYGQMLVNRHDMYIGRSLQLYGEWSEGEIDLFRQVLRPGMVAVDAGANIGTHTVAMAQAVAPNGVVYAFEPQRIVFQTLAANVALNSLTNVFCQQRALGEEPGIAWVPPQSYGTANNFGGVEIGAEAADGSEPVEVTRIDEFELAACHLIKIDVEGMELSVLKGAAETIARFQPLVYVEADREDLRDAVITWLDERGYAMYWHQVPLYNPANFKGIEANVFETVISLNILAIPSSVPRDVVGLEPVAVPGKALPSETPFSGEAATPASHADVEPEHAGARRRVRAARAARSARPATRLPVARAQEAMSAAAPVLHPPGPEALIPMLERAVAHHQAGRLPEATALYEAVLAVQPNEPDALHLLGAARHAQRRLVDALGLMERAVSLSPSQALFHLDLGGTQRQAGLLDAAERSLRQTLALSPGSPEAQMELALTLIDRRALAEAEALLLLLAGRYAEAWPEYAVRRQVMGLDAAPPTVPSPRWDGSPLAGRTILLESEEGHGDTIQFARYAPQVAATGGRVILRCHPHLVPLLRTLDGVSQIIETHETSPPVDVVAALPDLPAIMRTTLETIPAAVPYLHADPARVQAWAARLEHAEATRPRPTRRIGLVWAGNPDHLLDNQRSTTLATLAPLGAVPGVRFYALQKGAPAREALTPPPGLDFVDLSADLTNFMETAAVLSVLDLVITVDTSVGHLAGALGRPTWVLTWATHDWRWLLDRDDSPWYPSVRLFRQQTPHAWGPVVEAVAAALRQWSVEG